MPQAVDLGRFIWPDVSQGRQPQMPAGVDWANPLTASLSVLMLPGIAPGLNYANNRPTTPVNSPGSTINKFGRAADFNKASSQYINAGSGTEFDLGDEFTIVCIYSIKTIAFNDNWMLIAKDTNTGRAYTLDIQYGALATDSGVRLYVNGGGTGGANAVYEGRFPATGDSRIVVATRSLSKNNSSIYIDGALTGSVSASTSTPIVSNPTTIGAREYPGFAGYLDGSIALVVLFKRSLSASEAVAISANPWQLFATPYLPFGGAPAGGAANFLTLSASTGVSASRVAAVSAARSAATAAAVAIRKAAATSKAATTATAASRVAQATAVRAASTATAGSVRRTVSIIRAASSAVSAVLVKTVNITRAASTSCSAAIATLKAKLLTLSASVGTSATVRRAVNATRAAQAVSGAVVVKALAITRSAATAPAAALVRVVNATRTAATATAATFAGLKAKLLTLSATVGTSASLVRAVSVVRSASATTGATVRKAVAITRKASTGLVALIGLVKNGAGGGLVATANFIVSASGRVWKTAADAAQRIAKWEDR